jgi:hypothetical protein
MKFEDLKDQIKTYQKKFGVYLALVHNRFKIYQNRDNIKFCKKHGIRISGPRLAQKYIKATGA